MPDHIMDAADPAGTALQPKRAQPSEQGSERDRILSGYSLPTVEQLLRGYPFARGDLALDIRAFAETFLREMESKDQDDRCDDLRKAFSTVLADGSLASVREAAEILREVDISSWSPDARNSKLRCWIYAVHLGDRDCIVPVIVSSIAKAYNQDWLKQDSAADVVWWMLGMLTVYANDIPEVFPEPADFTKIERVADQIATAAAQYRVWMSAHLLSCEQREILQSRAGDAP